MGRTRLGRRRRAPRLINAALAPYCLPCLRKANGFLFIDVLESEGVFNGHIINLYLISIKLVVHISAQTLLTAQTIINTANT